MIAIKRLPYSIKYSLYFQSFVIIYQIIEFFVLVMDEANWSLLGSLTKKSSILFVITVLVCVLNAVVSQCIMIFMKI